MAEGGVSGIGLALGLTGAVLVVSATRNQPVADTLRSLIRGEPVAVRPSGFVPDTTVGGDIRGGSVTGENVAKTAASYIGVPYQWAHHTPAGWDCSGFVTWVLHHDYGIDLPDNTHTVTGQFYVWSGAVTVPRDQCQAGDLVCWISHIGIAINATQMVNAPGTGQLTKVDNIYGFPAPIIRRPKAYITADRAGNGIAGDKVAKAA